MSKKQKIITEQMGLVLVPEEDRPYELPANWVWVKSGSILNFVGGGTPSKDNNEYWNGDIPWATVKDIKKDYLSFTIDHITNQGLENSSATLAKPNELLLVTRMSPGKSTITKVTLTINQDLKIVRPKLKIPSYFLKLFFTFNKPLIESMTTGSTVKGIQVEKLKNIPFPLPPLDEQKRIAEKVENILNKIDQAQQLIRETKETFQIRRAAILDKAFRGGLTEDYEENDYKDFEEMNYPIPSEWEWLTIDEACELISDCPHSTPKYVDDGEYLAIRTSDITYGEIDVSKARKVSEIEYLKRTKRVQPVIGDIIYCREGSGGGVGKAGIVESDKICLAQRVVLMRCDKNKLLSKYFVYVLNSPLMLKQVYSNISQTTSPRINISTLKSLQIPVPPIEIQKNIVSIIETSLQSEKNAENLYSIENELDMVKRSIISKAFRGELGTNDLSEGSIIDVLKNIE